MIGLGYVGLPLVELFVSAGYPVLGFDIDPVKVDRLNRGESYIGHVNSDRVAAMQSTGRFAATADFARLVEADAILICVPTPLDQHRDPDLSAVINTGRAIGRHLRPDQLVVLESTTYPGTTRDVLLPELEASGLSALHDFFLAYSPEREDPGNANHSAGKIPKVVGGFDPVAATVAQALYGAVVPEVVPVSSCEVAEACKILENTFRAVNIAMINELKVLYDRMGIDVWEVIAAARTKPFGFMAFYPGPGLGGHCIPIDPFYLSWAARSYGLQTRFIELAGEINVSMPAYVVGKVTEGLNTHRKAVNGSRILILGVAYKPNIDDPRESPALELFDSLLAQGAEVIYNDPHIPRLPTLRHYPHLKAESQPLSTELLREQDCVLIVTNHATYDWGWIVDHSILIVDSRNATAGLTSHRAKIIRA